MYVLLNRCETRIGEFPWYLPRMYQTISPGLRNVTLFTGYDFDEQPILLLHWIDFLDDFITERLVCPHVYPMEGERLLKSVICFNGNLYHLLKNFRGGDIDAINFALRLKRNKGLYCLRVRNKYNAMLTYYDWTALDVEELGKYINDTVNLWAVLNTFLELPQFQRVENTRNIYDYLLKKW